MADSIAIRLLDLPSREWCAARNWNPNLTKINFDTWYKKLQKAIGFRSSITDLEWPEIGLSTAQIARKNIDDSLELNESAKRIKFWATVAKECLDNQMSACEIVTELKRIRSGSGKHNKPETLKLHWDGRKLWLGKRLICEYKRPAENQTDILNQFEEAGWPEKGVRICKNSREGTMMRLAETISKLSRKTKKAGVTFHGDGYGTGVTFKIIQDQ
jgi:hypothetical protein